MKSGFGPKARQRCAQASSTTRSRNGPGVPGVAARRTTTFEDLAERCCWFGSVCLDVRRLKAFGALRGFVLDLLAFFEVAVAAAGDGAEVHEYVWAAVVLGDKAEAFLPVEPLHDAGCHSDPLLSW